MRSLALLLVLGGCGGSSGGAASCPQATISATCATAALVSCHDGHGNACLQCAGAGAAPGCIYDPSAPLDGGTAVCVKQCSDCGADCQAMK